MSLFLRFAQNGAIVFRIINLTVYSLYHVLTLRTLHLNTAIKIHEAKLSYSQPSRRMIGLLGLITFAIISSNTVSSVNESPAMHIQSVRSKFSSNLYTLTVQRFTSREHLAAKTAPFMVATSRKDCICSETAGNKKQTVGSLFWQEYELISRTRSARCVSRVGRITRDQHLKEWVPFKDAEQRICAQSSPIPQRAFDSPRRPFFFPHRRYFFVAPKPITHGACH